MNFISLAVSVFISNYIFIRIIGLLPIKNKKPVQIIIISIADIASIISYLIILFSSSYDLILLLTIIGNIFGIGVAYIAIIMLLLDDVKIFKSKRTREFERGINNKEASSIPRYILSLISFGIMIALIVYGIINLLNYNQKLLISTIGVFIGAAVGLGLGIYFLISGLPQHQKIKAERLLFIITLPSRQIFYEGTLEKNNILASLEEIYILDEYGLIVKDNHKYIVNGIKIDSLTNDIEQKIPLTRLKENPFPEAIKEFNKYQRKKIILDENNNIKKISNIK